MLQMHRHNTYIIPYKDKFIIYQPLNKFAFIGNKAMVGFVEKILEHRNSSRKKTETIVSFLNANGFFNKYDLEMLPKSPDVYKPTVVVLCMTSACNFRCSYCFANGGEANHSELSPELGRKAIDMICQNACELKTGQFVVSFHGGGEPTLPFKKLQELTDYARQKTIPCRVEITSNGYWNERKTDWIISNMDNLTISFDGIKEVQNQQRPLVKGKNTFDVVMRSIHKLDSCGAHYGIRLTVTNNSVARLEESIKFLCRTTRCPTFQVEPAFGAGRALTNHQTIEKKAFIRHFLKAYDIAVANQRHLYYSGARPWVITHCFCTAHDHALVVSPDGILSSCYEISSNDHPLAQAFHFGELTAEGDLRIDFTKRERFQNRIQERKNLCQQCFCYWHCAGDCPAKTILPMSFDNNTFSQRCEVNREITKELLIRSLIDNQGIYIEE